MNSEREPTGKAAAPVRTHARFAYSPITQRPDFTWPQGRRLAVYIALNLEHNVARTHTRALGQAREAFGRLEAGRFGEHLEHAGRHRQPAHDAVLPRPDDAREPRALWQQRPGHVAVEQPGHSGEKRIRLDSQVLRQRGSNRLVDRRE